MVDSDSDPDQYDDFADDALEPYSNASFEVDLETRLKAVKREIKAKGRFANEGEVSDFLDRHSEVADKCVTKAGGNLLHELVEVVHHNEVDPSHFELLVRQLVKRWPRLLVDVNRDKHNPILMATRFRESRLVDYMISACNDGEHLENALKEKAQDGKTCLHAALKPLLPPRTIGRLIERASDDVLAVQDDQGRTPMHTAVSNPNVFSDLRIELLASLIDRDLKAPRGNPRQQETFLDLRDKSGRSVYRQLEKTREKLVKQYEELQAAQPQEADNRNKQSQGDAVRAAAKSAPRDKPRDPRQGVSTEPVGDRGSTDKQSSKATDGGLDKREQLRLQRKAEENRKRAEETKSPEIGETRRLDGVDAIARNGRVGERDSDSMELGDKAWVAVMPAPQALRTAHGASQLEPAPNTPLKRRATARFDANAGQEREAEKGRMHSAATKPRDSKSKPEPNVYLPERIKNATATLQRLKLQYMRTRSAEMAISFLYGNNIDGTYHHPPRRCEEKRDKQLLTAGF